jgi:hypothetical protein
MLQLDEESFMCDSLAIATLLIRAEGDESILGSS